MPDSNVFISWSGERSKTAATALRAWLPMVVQSASPWMSEEDIEKGTHSQVEITKALGDIKIGIICLTRENQNRPWVLFEAGALSKTLDDKTRVCTYLLGDLRQEDVLFPLGMFQGTKAVKDQTRRLVGTVNRALGGSLTAEQLDTVFDRLWPVLAKDLEAIPAEPTAEVPLRPDRQMIAEILGLTRANSVFLDQLMSPLQLMTENMRNLAALQRDQILRDVRLQAEERGFSNVFRLTAGAPKGKCLRLTTRDVGEWSRCAGSKRQTCKAGRRQASG